MASPRFAPIEEFGRIAKELEIELDARSVLLGYLFGRAAHEDRRLLTDRDHLRAYARSLLAKLP